MDQVCAMLVSQKYRSVTSSLLKPQRQVSRFLLTLLHNVVGLTTYCKRILKLLRSWRVYIVGMNVPPVSDAELEVMKALWAGGPGTVRELEARLRRKRRKWAYNTILTLLTRLREKGYVSADKSD